MADAETISSAKIDPQTGMIAEADEVDTFDYRPPSIVIPHSTLVAIQYGDLVDSGEV